MAAVMLVCAQLGAAELKIALVDMDKIFQEYWRTKVTEGNLKKQAEIFRSFAEQLNDSLLKLEEEFKELRDESQKIMLSDAERETKRLAAQEKYRQYQAKEVELVQYNREKQKQLSDEQKKLRAEILAEIVREVNRQASVQGLTLVIDKSGKTLNDIPSVVYFNPSLDITPGIVQELNRGHQEEAQSPPAKEGLSKPSPKAAAPALPEVKAPKKPDPAAAK
jgi:outer membrane protein